MKRNARRSSSQTNKRAKQFNRYKGSKPVPVMKTYTHYLYDLAENGAVFGCWYTHDEVAAMLATGKALYYDSALTTKVIEA